MAYFSQVMKKEKAPEIKALLKKYELKGSQSVHNHSVLVVTIRSGKLDFIGNYIKNSGVTESRESYTDRQYICVNPYSIESSYSGNVLEFLTELKDTMMKGNHDNSDSMTDYFDVGWYIDINIGTWKKPYVLIK